MAGDRGINACIGELLDCWGRVLVIRFFGPYIGRLLLFQIGAPHAKPT